MCSDVPHFFVLIQDEPQFMPGALSRLFDEFHENIKGVMPVSPVWHVKSPRKAICSVANMLGPIEFVRTGLRLLFLRQSVRQVCREFGCEPIAFVSPNSDPFRDLLRSLKIDILISYGCSIVLSKKTLQIPRITSLNVHGSYLPDFRGVYTVFFSMLNGASWTGATVHQMVEQIDAGGYYHRERIPITEESTLWSLYAQVAQLGTRLLIQTLHDACEGKLSAIPLPEGGQYVTFPTWSDGKAFRSKKLRYR